MIDLTHYLSHLFFRLPVTETVNKTVNIEIYLRLLFLMLIIELHTAVMHMLTCLMKPSNF